MVIKHSLNAGEVQTAAKRRSSGLKLEILQALVTVPKDEFISLAQVAQDLKAEVVKVEGKDDAAKYTRGQISSAVYTVTQDPWFEQCFTAWKCDSDGKGGKVSRVLKPEEINTGQLYKKVAAKPLA